jgi:chromate transporter
MASLLAIAQMTPGPIAINAATFTGFKTAGFYGSVSATAGVVFPALCLLFFLAPFFEKALEDDHLKRLWKGFDTGVLSLIIFAAWSFASAAVTSKIDLLIALGAFVLLVIFEGKVHPAMIIVIGGVSGLLLF